MYKLKSVPRASSKDISYIIQLLDKVQTIETWNSEKRNLMDTVRKVLDAYGSHFFSADRRTHGYGWMTRVGEYKILQKDHNRAGNLISFRGFKVFQVTVYSGERNSRGYAALAFKE